jgi:uncharacterized FlaG/YvyC family protein
MSLPISAVDGAGAAPPVASRQVRSQETPGAVPEAGGSGADEARQAVSAALRDGGNRIALGGHSAEFSYDAELDRVIVRIYSSDVPPREVIRQIPPQEYLTFVSRFREMFGVFFDLKL